MSYGVIQKKQQNTSSAKLHFLAQQWIDFYYFLGFVIYPIDWVIKLVSVRKWTKYASNHTKIAFVFLQT